ncbi:SDR family NAD(P)-dependent oxidoreductase [Okibacterium fritillariae]|uniref:NAD(P)-dependent dehydrogenase, short-chain alcohol dehydrogenase family n=1 Tax=Okibacterium fritillariae TaxID=123320 RepID=A0A1T5IAE0_9MICO|nr:SDR family oxidoreductase [Okibacterium fritillariae]SKC36146.1 NAD(P)-dependent dehydrogenase, short-chain alcohol dehydrogenase family [Okibacterium fritillariae]
MTSTPSPPAADRPAALVTGASRGIGRAIAIALAARGDRVAVHYGSSRADGEETLALLAGDGHVLVSGDLADADQVRALMDAASDALGSIHTLVNNAAVGPSATNGHRVDEVSYADWQRVWTDMIDVNLRGAANLTYCFANHRIGAGGGGTIVNIGSRGVFVGEPDYPAYAATKGALHAFAQSMAVALAPHDIAVSTIAPGFVSTDRQSEKLSGPAGDTIRAQSPFGRVATPHEIAAAVLYLSSPDATWASGTILDLNGASHLRS